jgi:hypothetical protein
MNILDQILNVKGQFVSVAFTSNVATSAKFKNSIKIQKITKAVVRAGINFANLTSVKEGIANDERSEVQELPWGSWIKFPYLIGHKGKEYLRLYPSVQNVPNVKYFVNGKETPKSEILQYLTPSKVAELTDKDRSQPECFTIKTDNVLAVG